MNNITRGPCAKQVVTATVITKNGEEFKSTNWCHNPQEVCPRLGMPSGEGYELCRDVCKQEGHAGVNAINLARDKSQGAILLLEGHTYACDNCKNYAKQHGIVDITIKMGD